MNLELLKLNKKTMSKMKDLAIDEMNEEREDSTGEEKELLHQFLDRQIFWTTEPDEMTPLLQYVRSRLNAGSHEVKNAEPFILALLRVKPGTAGSVLLAMLDEYMDRRPDMFNRVRIDLPEDFA